LKKYNLLLLFSFKVGLEDWKKAGLIDREVGYYRILGKYLKTIYFLTYDKKRILLKNNNIVLLINKWKLSPLLYSLFAPFIYIKQVKECDIIKSNQFNGAWIGAIIKKIFPHKLFVLRGGYIWGELKPQRNGNNFSYFLKVIKNKIANYTIKYVLKRADIILLTSLKDKDVLKQVYKQDVEDKIHYVYNSIDTDKFFPNNKRKIFDGTIKLITVARLVKMKNIQSIILSLKDFNNYEFKIIGVGPYRTYLENISKEYKVNVEFLGMIQNDYLPPYLQSVDIFIMPQLYGSGISKVVLEAMSCGNIVIVSDIEAHKSVVNNEYNGFICGRDVLSIKNCLKKVINYDRDKLMKISKNAVETMRSLYSMRSNAKKEYEIYNEILKSDL